MTYHLEQQSFSGPWHVFFKQGCYISGLLEVINKKYIFELKKQSIQIIYDISVLKKVQLPK